jgi:hypothetical protein
MYILVMLEMEKEHIKGKEGMKTTGLGITLSAPHEVGEGDRRRRDAQWIHLLNAERRDAE